MALFEPAPSRRYLAPQMMWFAAWLAITIVGAFLHPSTHGHGTHEQLGFPPCPSVLFFDRPCPGCGMTTSWSAFIHGDFALAFHAHPMGPIAYLGFTVSALMALIGFVRQERFVTESRSINWSLGAFAVAFFLFGVARMALWRGDYASQYEKQMVAGVRQ